MAVVVKRLRSNQIDILIGDDTDVESPGWRLCVDMSNGHVYTAFDEVMFVHEVRKWEWTFRRRSALHALAYGVVDGDPPSYRSTGHEDLTLADALALKLATDELLRWLGGNR